MKITQSSFSVWQTGQGSRVGVNLRLACIFQATHNQLMHAMNGNIPILRLARTDVHIHARIVLPLADLLEPPTQTVYSRDLLLSLRPHAASSCNLIGLSSQTTPPPSFMSSAQPPDRRTRQRLAHLNAEGVRIYHRHNKHKKNSAKFKSTSRAPPPSGTPGSLRGNEECDPLARAKAHTRGSKRRLRRQQYRTWKSGCNNGRVKGLRPPHPALGNPKNAARSNAQWFRTTVLWQQHDNRSRSKKVRNLPTTPPLEYASRIKIVCLNVQNFAETLKLKAAICLMKEHHLGLHILTETKSTQYYSYNSEGYLIVPSGTSKDKHGGVGAIVAPWMRPALLDVLQVSSRIIQLSFKKRGGNFHVIGAYAPHSGLDFEEVRDPYWESLETQLEAIPQPEPVYITGDMNVRFQAKHRHDGDVLGPFLFMEKELHTLTTPPPPIVPCASK